MSESGSYIFMPWLRRGVATQVTRVDGINPATPAPRSSFQVSVSFRGGLTAGAVNLALYGPGDVVGFDMRAVLRTWPAADVFEAESNYFPLIEFDPPDLPWRYTPAKANPTTERLRPWLCLIALKDDECKVYDAVGGNKLPVVEVNDTSVLPDLDGSWAWAHAQIIGATAATAEAARDVINKSPRHAISRIICPRKLAPRTPYTCFLVPTFERGRLAGLGDKLDDTIDAMRAAWERSGESRKLPIYYRWRFQTGGSGDFESLVLKLQPRAIDQSVGKREMDVSHPGGGLQKPPSKTSMALEGALQPLTARRRPWDETERAEWVSELKPLLNLSSTRLEEKDRDTNVTPPLYGRWHAARQEMGGDPTSQPKWFESLNIDPRFRVLAGLGTLVVQDQREALLASAWEQVGRIRAINEELRLAQLARESATSLLDRHLKPTDDDSFFMLTAPVQSLILMSGTTISAHIEASPIPQGVLDPSWRRIARRMGPLGHRQRRDRQPPPVGLLDRLNDGNLSAAPPPETPATVPKAIEISEPDGRLSKERIIAAPIPPNSVPYEPPFHSGRWEWAPESPGEDVPHQPGDVLRDPVIVVVDRTQTPPPAPPGKVKVDLDKIREIIETALDPKKTIEEPLNNRLKRPPGWNPEDPIEPIMAAPEFPQPMYEPLRDLSQDWLLPGLDKIESNTLALLNPNAEFIESYMVGLNHEMARVLLFNEYPTDQRGSYFRQFWDVRGCAGQVTAEQRKDIKSIHSWKDKELGANSPRPPGEQLVLLIRGELLQRYPNTAVYAVKAQVSGGGSRTLSTDPRDEKHPIFFGKLKPDVTFVGFALTLDEAKGSDTQPGWFFVLQEQPTEPRFGLDVADKPVAPPAATPADLSWGHFAKTDAELKQLNYLSFNGPLPAITNSEGAKWPDPRASDVAFVTLRRPYRIAVHASEMIV